MWRERNDDGRKPPIGSSAMIGREPARRLGEAREVAAVTAQEQARAGAAEHVGQPPRELVIAVRGRAAITVTPRSSRSAPGCSSITRANPRFETHDAAPAGTDDGRRARHAAQGRNVQVVGVAMRDQDEPDVAEVAGREARLDGASHPADPAPEHRIERDREPRVARDHRRMAAER